MQDLRLVSIPYVCMQVILIPNEYVFFAYTEFLCTQKNVELFLNGKVRLLDCKSFTLSYRKKYDTPDSSYRDQYCIHTQIHLHTYILTLSIFTNKIMMANNRTKGGGCRPVTYVILNQRGGGADQYRSHKFVKLHEMTHAGQAYALVLVHPRITMTV